MTENELVDALRDAIWLSPGDPEINDDALAIVRRYAAEELEAAAREVYFRGSLLDRAAALRGDPR